MIKVKRSFLPKKLINIGITLFSLAFIKATEAQTLLTDLSSFQNPSSSWKMAG